MKNKIFNLSIWGLLAISFIACKEEELRTHYPESMPVFDKASVAENAIVYGDSITLSVEVSDSQTPLSFLDVKVIVNDQLIKSERVRTKGNKAAYSKRYKIPFAAYMPDKAEVQVHLSAVNVEGTHKDLVLHNTIASRPPIPTIWLVTATQAIELPLTDAKNYIYSASGLTFGNEVSFRLATKLNRFKKIDWTDPANIVFGWVNNALGFINDKGEWIKLTDKSLVGFNKITLDLFNFTVKGEGEKLMPATSLDISKFSNVDLSSTDHLNVTTKETWKTANIYLGEGTEMTISGVADLANSMSPDFFEVTGGNTAKFLGKTGVYTVYYLPRMNYVFVEQPAAVYPEALWLCGVGFGPARQPYAKTSSWNWNSPLEYKFCRKVSAGVYETVMYVEHVEDAAAAEPWRLRFSAKFFHQRGWGGEEDARNYKMPNSLLSAPTTSDQGNFVGTADLIPVPGVYRFTIDVSNKKTTFVKIK